MNIEEMCVLSKNSYLICDLERADRLLGVDCCVCCNEKLDTSKPF